MYRQIAGSGEIQLNEEQSVLTGDADAEKYSKILKKLLQQKLHVKQTKNFNILLWRCVKLFYRLNRKKRL
jgi:hypothetical protein